ncbi:MAG: SiaB family protein kinase [Crocinitomicaceae bacterium]|nr:SiaB family protein kinase [Crocinitomicaceae bacterium]
MSSENSEISTVVKNTYQDIYDTFCAVPDSSVVIAHFGRFSQDLVNSISEGVENILISNDVKKNMIKRMFSVLIEGLQNIRIHGGSDSDDQQIGHVIVLRGCADYRVSFGSYASEEDRSFLTKHLDNINEKSLEEVKAFYLDVLSKGFLSNKGGAGLGFITIALTSKSAIYYAFHPTDYKDLHYFDFSVELKID